MLAAKYGKQIGIGLAVLVVIACVYFAVKMHERTQDKLAAAEAARASQAVAHEVTIASLENQRKAAAEWQASAERYKTTLEGQQQFSVRVRQDEEMMNEIFQKFDLSKLAREEPNLAERAVNDATRRVIRLLNCSSTARGCAGDSGASAKGAGDPLPAGPGPGRVRLDGHGPGALPGPGSGVLLPGPDGLRSSGPK